MIRFVVIAVGLALFVSLLLKLVRALRRAEVDWGGILFACAFVALALFLRHATGIGGIHPV